jgi:DTW domain-containing protein
VLRRRGLFRFVPPGRCARCAFPEAFCLCPELAPIPSRVAITVVRHASEIPRLTNSARWAALALERAELLDHALPGCPFDDASLREPGAVLLFPGGEPWPAGAPPPRRVVVPDGTWGQARRMVQRLEPLRALPRLTLPLPPPAFRLRRAPEGGMSTAEAIAGALRLVGDTDAADALLRVHAAAVERCMRLSGTWERERERAPRARRTA